MHFIFSPDNMFFFRSLNVCELFFGSCVCLNVFLASVLAGYFVLFFIDPPHPPQTSHYLPLSKRLVIMGEL